MLKPLLIVLSVIISFTARAQNILSEKDVVGTWKMIALDMAGQMYVNFENDSVSISDSLKKSWKSEADSSLALGMLLGMTKAMKDMEFDIQPGGIFRAQMGPKGEDGTYLISGDRIILTLKTEGDPLSGLREKELLKFEAGLNSGNKKMTMFFRRK